MTRRPGQIPLLCGEDESATLLGLGSTTREETMTTTQVRSNDKSGPSVHDADMKLEVVVIPVSDVDRAKEFYENLGWRLDADRSVGDDFRLVQLTPPGSACSIQFGTNLTSAAPGSAKLCC
jgi:hypothetical protein